MMVHPLQCQSLQRSLHLQERRCAKHLLWASGRTLLVHTPQGAAVSQTLTVNRVEAKKTGRRHRSALTIMRAMNQTALKLNQPVPQKPQCAANTVPENTVPLWTRPARKSPARKCPPHKCPSRTMRPRSSCPQLRKMKGEEIREWLDLTKMQGLRGYTPRLICFLHWKTAVWMKDCVYNSVYIKQISCLFLMQSI